jgi:hypothetical protein
LLLSAFFAQNDRNACKNNNNCPKTA